MLALGLDRQCRLGAAVPVANKPFQQTRAGQFSVEDCLAVATRPIGEAKSPRGPGSVTIDHHLTALAAERQGVSQTGPLGGDAGFWQRREMAPGRCCYGAVGNLGITSITFVA